LLRSLKVKIFKAAESTDEHLLYELYGCGGNGFQALYKQPPLFIAWTLHRADRKTSYELNHGSPPFGDPILVTSMVLLYVPYENTVSFYNIQY